MVRTAIRKCRVCGKEAYVIEDLEEFATDKDAKLGVKAFCKVCHSKASTLSNRIRRQENKQNIKDYLGGAYKCFDCGLIHDYLGVFDWHHLDSSIKERGVSRILHYGWSTVLHEIKKCVFLCANCHRLRHQDQSL